MCASRVIQTRLFQTHWGRSNGRDRRRQGVRIISIRDHALSRAASAYLSPITRVEAEDRLTGLRLTGFTPAQPPAGGHVAHRKSQISAEVARSDGQLVALLPKSHAYQILSVVSLFR
jgi:hypothetical protein